MSTRIAFVTPEYPPFVRGGAGVYAYRVTEEVSESGNDVVVFTPGTSDRDVDFELSRNLEVRRLGVGSLPFLRTLMFWVKLPRAMKKADEECMFDVVHFNGLAYGSLVERVLDAPHLVTIHHLAIDSLGDSDLPTRSRIRNLGGERGFVARLVEKRSIRIADVVIAVSNYTKHRILEEYLIPDERVLVIRNGVDSSLLPATNNDVAETRKGLSIPDGKLILFVGRVDDPRKDLDTLIRAFGWVRQTVESHLLVVGGGNQDRARNLVTSLGLSDHVSFFGYVAESLLKSCYAMCDVYVSTSRMEGFGLTIAEALAAGKPVVVRDAGALKEIVENGQNGIILKDPDYMTYGRAILRILSDSSLSSKMALSSLSMASRLPSWLETGHSTILAYTKSLKRWESRNGHL